MAIINLSHDFVFVHIPKAAGTSVSKYFTRYNHYCDLEIGGTGFGEAVQTAYQQRFGLSKHSPASVIRNVMGEIAWSKTTSFSFVRNPYTRLVSTYNFLCKWPGCPDHLQQELLAFESLDDYVLSDIWRTRSGPDGMFLPQNHWTSKPSAPRHLLLDHVAKVEDIDNELATLAELIGLKTGTKIDKAPALNRSVQRYGVDELSAEAIALINEHYLLDFELFDYEMIDADALDKAA